MKININKKLNKIKFVEKYLIDLSLFVKIKGDNFLYIDKQNLFQFFDTYS